MIYWLTLYLIHACPRESTILKFTNFQICLRPITLLNLSKEDVMKNTAIWLFEYQYFLLTDDTSFNSLLNQILTYGHLFWALRSHSISQAYLTRICFFELSIEMLSNQNRNAEKYFD